MAAAKDDLSTWDIFRWRRKMERFGDNDKALVAAGPSGETDSIWQVALEPKLLGQESG
jgi:acid phosphatase